VNKQHIDANYYMKHHTQASYCQDGHDLLHMSSKLVSDCRWPKGANVMTFTASLMYAIISVIIHSFHQI
jgi:hypothetical protein